MEVKSHTNQLAGWPSGNYINYKMEFPVRLTGGFVLDIAHDGFRMLRLVGHHRPKGKICPLVLSNSRNFREIKFFFVLSGKNQFSIV